VYVFVALAGVFYACYLTWLNQNRAILGKDQIIFNRERENRKLIEALHLQIDDTIQEIAIGPKSRFSPGEKLGILWRREQELRLELERAAVEDKFTLIKKLEENLRRQLDLAAEMFQRSSVNFQEEFNKIALKLEELRDLTKRLKL
jgi:hypothetical protein